MEYKQIQEATKKHTTIDIRGKRYMPVNEKVIVFRELYPEGCIDTHLIAMKDGVCVIQANVYDDGHRLLGSGIAYEKENSTFINKTSYVENCETSAIGRALSSLGIGCQDSYASANEMENAITNQNKVQMATETEKKTSKDLCKMFDVKPIDIIKQANPSFKNGNKLTKDTYAKCQVILKEIEESRSE